jgi:hypothetical protein
MKEWKKSVSEKIFFAQEFIQGEIFAADIYFYADDIIYYAQENGLTIERATTPNIPEEYKNKANWSLFTIVHTKFQMPMFSKIKPIQTSLTDIL